MTSASQSTSYTTFLLKPPGAFTMPLNKYQFPSKTLIQKKITYKCQISNAQDGFNPKHKWFNVLKNITLHAKEPLFHFPNVY